MGAYLHQGHMLMGRRMIDDIRPVQLKDLFHPGRITHRADQYLHIQMRIFLFQLLLYLINSVFINIKNDQTFGIVLGDLSAQLASDGAAASCHQHRLATDIADDLIHIHLNGIPPQQILNLHLS